jgi:hypothetical protein
MHAHGLGECVPALLQLGGGRRIQSLRDCATLSDADLVVRARVATAAPRGWLGGA